MTKNEPKFRLTDELYFFRAAIAILEANPRSDLIALSVCRAIATAIKTPGSLVRITSKDIDETVQAARTVEQLLASRRLFDEKKTKLGFKSGECIYELLNGSGIQLACEYTTTSGKVISSADPIPAAPDLKHS